VPRHATNALELQAPEVLVQCYHQSAQEQVAPSLDNHQDVYTQDRSTNKVKHGKMAASSRVAVPMVPPESIHVTNFVLHGIYPSNVA